jgi:hypothetical protein
MQNNIELLQSDVKSSFLDENPVSTILNLYLDKNELLLPLLDELNKICYKGKKMNFNFVGKNGVYHSKCTYSNFMKYTEIKKTVEKFEKTYKCKINWIVSTPFYLMKMNIQADVK